MVTPRPGTTSAVASSGSVSRNVWDRMPIASPATSAPHTRAEGAARRLRTETMSACAAIAAPRPVMSLSGRSDVNQKSGDVTAISTAHSANEAESRSAPPGARAVVPFPPPSARYRTNRNQISAAPERVLHTESPRTSGTATPAARRTADDSLLIPMNTGYPGGWG